MLSLQALFDLIMKHNLDYPDFFAKLYLLLQPSVLHTKYRARFLRLLGVFLASPLMPTYIVASYAKRYGNRLSWCTQHLAYPSWHAGCRGLHYMGRLPQASTSVRLCTTSSSAIQRASP